MSADLEAYIRQKCPWTKLPSSIKQTLGDPKKYELLVIEFSIKNQLRFRGNLVRNVKKDERGYYDDLLRYSREHLMLYPYHLSDFIVTFMRITPFQYYISIMQDLMEQERSYDSLPNFTAVDCLRLLGIGRNQYIELMNQCRASKKFFAVHRSPIRDLLPPKPVSSLIIEPWWKIFVGYVTEDDIKNIPEEEKIIIDNIIDNGPQKAGNLNMKDVKALYRKGLIYIDVPIEDHDCVVVPPLEGFVMNRILGDYLETLLYKIFVSIDEHITIAELANILQIELELVKNAVSMYCRLGFARKKLQEDLNNLHQSWQKYLSSKQISLNERDITPTVPDILLCEDTSSIDNVDQVTTPENTSPLKKIGFLFDSTLTAFLMMGNLSPDLKRHAVTMFEVGKLTDNSLDSFLVELLKIDDVGEGEARTYFTHAVALRDTISFLRRNPELTSEKNENQLFSSGLRLDMLRCESLQNLDAETCSRLLNKNYSLLISMAPLTNEIRPISSCCPPHLGPPIPEASSVWFKLFIYSVTKCGPPSLLLTKGTRLHILPNIFREHEKLLVTTWSHDACIVPMSNALPILNDALSHAAVLVQGLGSLPEFCYMPFPLENSTNPISGNGLDFETNLIENHFSVETLRKIFDFEHNCGFLTFMYDANEHKHKKKEIIFNHAENVNDIGMRDMHISAYSDMDKTATQKPLVLNFSEDSLKPLHFDLQEKDFVLLDCCFGIPLFNRVLNKKICDRLLSKELCKKASLEKLVSSNRKLCLQLLEFISEYQPVINSDIGRNTSFPPNRPGCDTELPLPTENLIFHNGKLSIWNGKKNC